MSRDAALLSSHQFILMGTFCAVWSMCVDQILGDWRLRGSDREEFSAKLARRYAELNVQISTGSDPKKIADIFEAAGVSPTRLHLGYQAVDTVTS